MGRFLCKIGIHNCIQIVDKGAAYYKCILCDKLIKVKTDVPKCCK